MGNTNPAMAAVPAKGLSALGGTATSGRCCAPERSSSRRPDQIIGGSEQLCSDSDSDGGSIPESSLSGSQSSQPALELLGEFKAALRRQFGSVRKAFDSLATARGGGPTSECGMIARPEFVGWLTRSELGLTEAGATLLFDAFDARGGGSGLVSYEVFKTTLRAGSRNGAAVEEEGSRNGSKQRPTTTTGSVWWASSKESGVASASSSKGSTTAGESAAAALPVPRSSSKERSATTSSSSSLIRQLYAVEALQAEAEAFNEAYNESFLVRRALQRREHQQQEHRSSSRSRSRGRGGGGPPSEAPQEQKADGGEEEADVRFQQQQQEDAQEDATPAEGAVVVAATPEPAAEQPAAKSAAAANGPVWRSEIRPRGSWLGVALPKPSYNTMPQTVSAIERRNSAWLGGSVPSGAGRRVVSKGAAVRRRMC